MTTSQTIHFDGYPADARVAVAQTASTAASLDMLLHRRDLETSRDLFDAAGAADTPDNLRVHLWNGAIAAYCKCFQAAKSRSRLNIDTVLEGVSDDARKAFDYFMNLRNKHLLHDENAYSQVKMTVVIDASNEANPLLGSHVFTFEADTYDEPHIQSFTRLLSHTAYWVARKAHSLSQSVQDELALLTREQLLAFESLVVKVPTADDVSKPR